MVEQQGGVAHVPLVQVDEAAQLVLGTRAVDARQLANLVHASHPLAQVPHGHGALQSADRPIIEAEVFPRGSH